MKKGILKGMFLVVFGLVVLSSSAGRAWAVNDVSINDITITEGDTGTVDAVFTVTLSNINSFSPSATVDFITQDVTASAGSDFIQVSGRVSLSQTTPTRTITVQVRGDSMYEDSETFRVILSNPSNATITDGQGIGRIQDDDPVPSLSLAAATVQEGDTGTVNAIFEVTLSNPTIKVVTVDFATQNGSGSATAGNDYTATNGTLTFSPGVTSRTITVPVIGDILDEEDETFLVDLVYPATNATIMVNQRAGTITDNDPSPSLSIDNVTVTEGDSGIVDAVFTVTLSQASGRQVYVNYSTEEGTATVIKRDFHLIGDSGGLINSGTLTFPKGTISKTITVEVYGDRMYEDTETFFVNLSNPTNVTIADGQGLGTIINDDSIPSLSIGGATVFEGNSGTVNANFAVELSNPTSREVTVQFAALSYNIDGYATSGSDFTPNFGTLTFPPEVSYLGQIITVPVIGDTLDEGNEIFPVVISNPVNATISNDQGVGNIMDDDGPPELSLNSNITITVTEGDSGTVDAVFTVNLSQASGREVKVDFSTEDGTASAGSDYTLTRGTLIFPKGTTSQTITVPALGDTLDEEDREHFRVRFSNPVNTFINRVDTSVVGFITDDDSPPSVSIDDVTVQEGDTGTVDAVFTVTLSQASGKEIITSFVTYTLYGSVAAAEQNYDYTSTNGTLTFPAGTTSQTITVPVLGDTLDEDNEIFHVRLYNNNLNVLIADGDGVGTITDNDPMPSVSIDDISIQESNEHAIFTITLSQPSGRRVAVDLVTADGTAVSGNDYYSLTGSSGFSAGQTSRSVEVPVQDDPFNEPDKTFFVRLSNPVNATIADGEGIGTIINDDPVPSISVNDISVTERNSGEFIANFAVFLSQRSAKTVTVDFVMADGTASAGSDYTSNTGTLTFAPGAIPVDSIYVTIKGDRINEPNETFFLRLSNPVNATIADGEGTGTITNDDILIPAAERDALVALYDSTKGIGWINKDGWLGAAGTECSWYGVTCIETGLVGIYLNSNQLNGLIPAELGNLTNLQILDLSNNPQLGGLIPPEIGNLSNLQLLALSNNQLSGVIPVELGTLSNLQTLSLGNNQLSGVIPAELGNLTNIQFFQLYKNQLSGLIPVSLGNLTNISELSLYDNRLTGAIPPELGNFTNIRSLHLANNQLSGPIPVSLSSLTNLQTLVLSNNQLNGQIPAGLAGLSNLQSFFLNSNKLEGEIPIGLTSLPVLLNDGSDLRWNALYTNDAGLKVFLDSKQAGSNWESTQTIAPTVLVAETIGDNTIGLDWTDVTYTAAGGYEVYSSLNPGGPYTLVETITDKTVVTTDVTGLVPGTDYYFVLRTFTNPHGSNQNTVYSGYGSEVTDKTTGIAPPPDITVINPSDLTISFGSVTTGNILNQVVTLQNDGTGALNISGVTAPGGSFNIQADNCSGKVIAPLATCTLTVQFAPSASGAASSSFDINSDSPGEGTVTINMSGTGVTQFINNAPSGFSLVYPQDGQTGVPTSLTFIWKQTTDPDGNPVTYTLYYCDNQNVESCSPVNVASVSNAKVLYGSIAGNLLIVVLGMIIAGALAGRKGIVVCLMIVLLAGSALTLTSCSGGGGGGNSSGSSSPPASGAPPITPTPGAGETGYSMSGLSSNTTYYWKVTASDNSGSSTSSAVQSFVTQ